MIEYNLLIVDYAMMERPHHPGDPVDADDVTDTPCNIHPSVFFLVATLLVTSCATAMLCGAIVSDHWEEVEWDSSALDALANRSQKGLPQVQVDWLLERRVARVSTPGGRVYLAPIQGGIWTLCYSLTENEILQLIAEFADFPHQAAVRCINYLQTGGGGEIYTSLKDVDVGCEFRTIDWQRRMQNLSISCALVCLILLGTAAAVGAFGLCQHQISAVLVTGVMYLLAASFALFTVSILHFKRPRVSHGDEPNCVSTTMDGVIMSRAAALGNYNRIWTQVADARVMSTSWSLDLALAGIISTAIASMLWLLLAKVMLRCGTRSHLASMY